MIEKLIERIKLILTTPKEAWLEISAEEKTPKDIVKEYLIYIAAIPAVAQFIGFSIIGTNYPLVGHIRTPFFSGLLWAVFSYLLTFVGIYLIVYIINALAPSFQAEKDDKQIFKLIAYSYTPFAVTGIFNIIPSLTIIHVLGFLYGLYVFYIGMPTLLKYPEDKKLSYTIMCGIIIIVVTVIMRGIANFALGTDTPHPMF